MHTQRSRTQVLLPLLDLTAYGPYSLIITAVWFSIVVSYYSPASQPYVLTHWLHKWLYTQRYTDVWIVMYFVLLSIQYPSLIWAVSLWSSPLIKLWPVNWLFNAVALGAVFIFSVVILASVLELLQWKRKKLEHGEAVKADRMPRQPET